MNNKPFIITLSGKAGSGKDTVADMLVTELRKKDYPTGVFSFAAALKQITFDLWGCRSYTQEEKQATIEVHQPLPTTIKVRKLLQDVGMLMRQIDENIWVDKVYRDIQLLDEFTDHTTLYHPLVAVITDCRFPNELKISDLSIYIDREDPNQAAQLNLGEQAHPSETSIGSEDCQMLFENNVPLKELAFLTIPNLADKVKAAIQSARD